MDYPLVEVEGKVISEPVIDTEFWQCRFDTRVSKITLKVHHKIKVQPEGVGLPDEGDHLVVWGRYSDNLLQVSGDMGFCWVIPGGKEMFEAYRHSVLHQIYQGYERLNGLIRNEQIKLMKRERTIDLIAKRGGLE